MNKLFFALSILFCTSVSAQHYFTKNGSISFFSEAPVENIEAANNKVTAIIDSKTGDIEFAVLMKAFQFEKALMQEHFNENYVHSDKYPKAKFKGELEGFDGINWTKDGEYKLNCVGDLTLHGQTKPVSTPFTIKVKGEVITGTSEFTILLSDYKIEIPSVVKDNISNSILIKVSTQLWELAK